MGELLESRAQGQSVLKPRAQSRTHRSAIQAALAAERYEGRLQGLAVRQDAPGPLGRMRLTPRPHCSARRPIRSAIQAALAAERYGGRLRRSSGLRGRIPARAANLVVCGTQFRDRFRIHFF